jgi:hypothetical protein
MRVKLLLWIGALIVAALGFNRVLQSNPSRAKRAIRMGSRILRNFRIAGMMNISPRYIAGFGRRIVRRLAR